MFQLDEEEKDRLEKPKDGWAEFAETLPNSRQASLKGDSWVLRELGGWLVKEDAEYNSEAVQVFIRRIAERLRILQEEAPVSEPAKILKEKLTGDSWVLKELKEVLKERRPRDNMPMIVRPAYMEAIAQVRADINMLESQAPVSGLAKEIKEDRRKAEAWKLLYITHKQGIQFIRTKKRALDPAEQEEHCYQLVEDMDELLSQSKKPKAEEEK